MIIRAALFLIIVGILSPLFAQETLEQAPSGAICTPLYSVFNFENLCFGCAPGPEPGDHVSGTLLEIDCENAYEICLENCLSEYPRDWELEVLLLCIDECAVDYLPEL